MSELRVINYDEALAALEQARDTMGSDFVYSHHNASRCWYRPLSAENAIDAVTDDPRCLTGCLIGTALKILGFEPTENWEGTSVSSVLAVLSDQHVARFTEKASVLYESAQRSQDAGSTWGVAVENAFASVAHAPEPLSDV